MKAPIALLLHFQIKRSPRWSLLRRPWLSNALCRFSPDSLFCFVTARVSILIWLLARLYELPVVLFMTEFGQVPIYFHPRPVDAADRSMFNQGMRRGE